MNGAQQAAQHAVRELAARPFVFSAQEVAALADLARDAPAVEEALRMRCLRRDIVLVGGARRRFLGQAPALRWWCRYAAHLARLGINRLSSAQLRAAMALALDRRRWDALPAGLLDIGRRMGMVANGGGDALVFPWAALLQTNPACLEGFEMMFHHQTPPKHLRGLTLDTILGDVLAQLSEREADVLRKRHGLDGERVTLARLGAHYQVTRERIRQIERKATAKIMQSNMRRKLWWAFVADFMQSGVSLVISDAQLTPQRRFLYKMVDLNAQPVAEFNVRIIGPARHIEAYRDFLRRDLLDESEADGRLAAEKALSFMPARDLTRIVRAQQQQRGIRIAKSAPRMIQKALRALGRAAHYTEIAQTCNRLFPEHERSARNCHAALLRFAGQEKFGIVWVGRKGMYGLKEHGYSRPAEGLYAAVERIVREQFAATNRPAPFEAVLQALSKQRREFNPGSVAMALAFSGRIEKTDNGYLPAAAPNKTVAESKTAAESNYDIATAMRAFTGQEGEE